MSAGGVDKALRTGNRIAQQGCGTVVQLDHAATGQLVTVPACDIVVIAPTARQ